MTAPSHNFGIAALSLLALVVAGGSLYATYSGATSSSSIGFSLSSKKKEKDTITDSNESLRCKTGYDQLVGNTPMIKLHHLSKLLKRHIFVKVRKYQYLLHLSIFSNKTLSNIIIYYVM